MVKKRDGPLGAVHIKKKKKKKNYEKVAAPILERVPKKLYWAL